MSDARARDAAARRAAQTDFAGAVVVEAGAGTGKTALLVARIVAWCLGPGWERAERALRETTGGPPGDESVAARTLSRLAAITFTDAAAAEMATRVGEALAHLERGTLPVGLLADVVPPDGEDRRGRARALLASLDRAVVTTIHGYCRRLLAAHSLEAGVHPRFTVDAEGDARREAVRRVVSEWGAAAYAGGDADALALAATGVGPPEIADALEICVERAVPDEALAEPRFTAESAERVRAALAAALRAFDTAGGGALAGASRAAVAVRTVAALGDLAATLRASHPGGPLDALCAAAGRAVEHEALERIQAWAAGDFGKDEARCVGARGGEVAAACGALAPQLRALAALDPETFELGRRVLAPLLAGVRRELRRRGALGYADLLAGAARLLSERPGVRARVRAELDQLLVDEFQDTDRLQCEIVRLLALDGPPEERPGLFLVGDPKQSIYGWRNADLTAYSSFVEAALGGARPHALVVNYRSVPEVLAEVTALVRPVMREERGIQARFEELLACPQREAADRFATDRHAPVEHWISWLPAGGAKGGPKTARRAATELEAAAIARDVRRLHDEHGVPWGACALLLRSSPDIDAYLHAFQEQGVPYAVERDRNYYRRREVIDAAALVRCALDPADHLSLLTVLRSSQVGVPDAALLPLWRAGLPERVTALDGPDAARLAGLDGVIRDAAAAVPVGIPGIEAVAGWPAALRAFLAALATLRASFAADAPDVFVEKLRTLTLLEAGEASRHLGTFRAANLERFFRRLSDALCAGADAHAVLRLLRVSVEEAREAEEGRPPEAAAEAVRVMTIHKAKGLDFDHVYMAQLHKGTRDTRSETVDVAALDGGFEVVLFGAPGPRWAEVEDRRRRVADAELVRTLYVAATRARDRLVLAGAWPAAAARANGPTSHAHLLRRRDPGPPDLEALLGDLPAGPEAPFADAAGARWVFPGLAAPAEAEPRRREAAAPVGLDRVVSDAAALREARAAAERRMARPISAPASAEAHERLAARLDRGDDEAPPRPRGQDAATAVGIAVHAFLERVDPGAADLAAELRKRREEALAVLAGHVAPGDLAAAADRLEETLDRMLSGAAWRRLATLATSLVARELPVLLPPDGEDGPVGYVAGVIDLLYRDPETGELVIADYKTDAVEPGPELDERVAAYAAQGRVYVRAVQQALALPAAPRFELWLLHADVITAPASGT